MNVDTWSALYSALQGLIRAKEVTCCNHTVHLHIYIYIWRLFKVAYKCWFRQGALPDPEVHLIKVVNSYFVPDLYSY